MQPKRQGRVLSLQRLLLEMSADDEAGWGQETGTMVGGGGRGRWGGGGGQAGASRGQVTGRQKPQAQRLKAWSKTKQVGLPAN